MVDLGEKWCPMMNNFPLSFWFSGWISLSWWFGFSDCHNTAIKAIVCWNHHSFLYKSNSSHIFLQIVHSHRFLSEFSTQTPKQDSNFWHWFGMMNADLLMSPSLFSDWSFSVRPCLLTDYVKVSVDRFAEAAAKFQNHYLRQLDLDKWV